MLRDKTSVWLHCFPLFCVPLNISISMSRYLPFSCGNGSISQLCLLMLKRELICRRSFLMNGPARFTLFVMDVGGGAMLLLLFVVGGVVVTVMLGGDFKNRNGKGFKLLFWIGESSTTAQRISTQFKLS